MDHRHFFEPTSLGAVVELHSRIMTSRSRRVDWIHCPIPLSAMNNLDDFFAPLQGLSGIIDSGITKLYLGLIHPHDLEGAKARIKAAHKVVSYFGVATECGWGRTPSNDLQSIMRITRAVQIPCPILCRDGDDSTSSLDFISDLELTPRSTCNDSN